MPQSNVSVSEVDLRSDFKNYYRHSFVTYKGSCAQVLDFSGNGNGLKAHIALLDGNHWCEPTVVMAHNLDFTIPRLGFVEHNKSWYFLSRKPARRMRKGYCDESIEALNMGPNISYRFSVSLPEVLNQVWNGNKNRISHDSVIIGDKVFYQQSVVGDIKKGKIVLVPGKEKLGEYVCKLLAANWEFHSSKHSLLPLN